MRKVDQGEDILNEVRRIVTYELANGRRIQLDADAVRRYGAAELVRRMGYGSLIPRDRLAVVQDRIVVGSVPMDFDPEFIESTSELYSPRRGDFKRSDTMNVWIASSSLGMGDLKAIRGFEPYARD